MSILDSAESMAANYLHLPGVTGNYTFVPNVSNLDGSGTLEFIAKVALDDWTPDANQVWISKWTGSAGYLFFLESTSNDLKLMWRDSGPARIAQATETPTAGGDGWLWVYAVATEDGVDRDVVFYTSTDETNNPDEVTWTQLGAEVVVPFGAADLTTNTAVVFVGAQSNTVATMAGSIAAARVNFAGVTELDIDFTDLTAAEVDAGSFTEDSGNAATVTIAGAAWAYVRLQNIRVILKIVARITAAVGTTEADMVGVFGGIRPGLHSKVSNLVAAAPAADQARLGMTDYRLKAIQISSTEWELYPKDVVYTIVDMATTEDDVRGFYEGYYDSAKQTIRDALIAAPAALNLQILGWHVHRLTGDVDELEG